MNSSIELISIGSELLSGRTLNTHAQTLGAALTEIGLTLSRDTTIPDEIDTIQSVVKEAFERTDIVVVSGGLGPTVDDITREALAALFKVSIVTSPSGLAEMTRRFDARGISMTPASARMALILEGAETLLNSVGAASGQRLDLPDLGKTLFIVPGPPKEFAAMLSDHLVPWLRAAFPDAAPLQLRVLTTQGIGESSIVTMLEAAGFQYSEISVGFYPGAGMVEIRLNAPTEKAAALDDAERMLRELLHDYLID
ncbi:competence/damage-inducible protein A [Tichowtungia aerotolerans]|uniref:MoaB/Mog domain-containing protein n=1 Tax=Tichowtungia aerotolerans TaxID=2697043 RepID=A0A6P1M6Y5_9BACT|nr:molybdopterin-binding protein [Tichowtungia aerotolerans]QHI69611.1 hypothetical protein GT409_09125 [Tichowtungia aerotolerans]